MHNHTHNEEELGKQSKRMFFTMCLNFLITAVEIIGGILSGSLSLISDALHNFTDGTSIIISYIAIKLKSKDNSLQHTFGLKRAEILAAIINSSVLFGVSIYLFYEAISRFFAPPQIESKYMIGIGAVGLVANVIGTLLLRKGSKHSINIKSAYLHLMVDAMSSVAVVLGGIFIMIFDIVWLDSILVLIIGIYIGYESYKIIKKSVHILMEGVPEHVNLGELKNIIEEETDVNNIHHVHVWSIGEKDYFLEAHVDIEDMMISQTEKIYEEVAKILKERFHIGHTTLQFECKACDNKDLIQDRTHGI